MPDPLKAVFFDVDGVLIDSLPQHLQICRDKAKEYGLRLQIPNTDQFRELVRRGTKVSPMLDFFRAVGFPRTHAMRAVDAYQREFMARYRPQAFAGVEDVLMSLRKLGLLLGLVTSNTQANVVPALGQSMKYFDPDCLFFYDRYPEPKSKIWCLLEGARILGLRPDRCLYVGDQPVDASAAHGAGVRFLGVTYGWGIAEGDGGYPTVGSVREIATKVAMIAAR